MADKFNPRQNRYPQQPFGPPHVDLPHPGLIPQFCGAVKQVPGLVQKSSQEFFIIKATVKNLHAGNGQIFPAAQDPDPVALLMQARHDPTADQTRGPGNASYDFRSV
jgi:hypothetical protein